MRIKKCSSKSHQDMHHISFAYFLLMYVIWWHIYLNIVNNSDNGNKFTFSRHVLIILVALQDRITLDWTCLCRTLFQLRQTILFFRTRYISVYIIHIAFRSLMECGVIWWRQTCYILDIIQQYSSLLTCYVKDTVVIRSLVCQNIFPCHLFYEILICL